ncbi:MAG: O-antigen ligase family protein [Acidobacteriota bacterium]
MKPVRNIRASYAAIRGARLPGLLLLVVVTTVVACVASGQVFGFSLSGWAWVIPFVLAGFVALANASKVTFPIMLWLPWALWVLGYLLFEPYPHALQRSVMLLCPLVVGQALSTYRLTAAQLSVVGVLMRWVAGALWVVVLLNTGLLVTGRLPAATGMAPQAITACLLASLFAAEFAEGRKGALAWWASIAVIPVIALTRTAIAAAAVTLPFSLGKVGLRRRLVFIGLIAAGLVFVFYTPRVQHKMFFSGQGTLSELSFSNPNLQTSGREMMWQVFDAEIQQRPWLGHGANASEELVNQLIPGLGHPHNDYIRLKYDYGYIGLCLFLLGLAGQALHAWRRARKAAGPVRWLLLGAVSAFLPFLIMMKTDNIVLYCAFFGNLQFSLLGLGYGVLRAEAMGALPPVRPPHPPSMRRPVPALPAVVFEGKG